MSDHYPSNSHSQGSPRPARQKQSAVITNVHIRKKPFSSRIADRGAGIWKDILFEVIGPYFRDMFADSGYTLIDMIFYNDRANRPRSGRPTRPGGQPNQHVAASGYVVTDYNSQYTTGANPVMHDPTQKPFDFSIFQFADYAAGREIIERIYHTVNGYGRVTANDVYELFNKVGVDHTGENYGWDGMAALEGIDIRRVRGGGGYYLDIPDAKPLKK